MIQIQVAPREGADAYQLLRSKVLHGAATWYWANKAKTRLMHLQSEGHIQVAEAGGVVVARVVPKAPRDLFYLAEKFMGRLVAWFEADLAAINVQFGVVPQEPKRRRRKAESRKAKNRKAKNRKRR